MNNAFIILNWNEPTITAKSVESVIKYEPNSGIVVIDNGSDIEKRELLINELKLYGFDFINDKEISNDQIKISSIGPKICLLLDSNYGYAVGNNKALRLVDKIGYKFATIMNNDVFINEPVSNRLINCFSNDILLTIPRVYLPNGEEANPLNITNTWYYNFWIKLFFPILAPINHLKKKSSSKANSHSRILSDNELFSGCFFTVKLDLFKLIGYFDEKTFLGSEELIIMERARSHGLEVFFCSESSVLHKNMHTSSQMNRVKLSKITYKSKRYYFSDYKHYGKIKLILLDFAQYIWMNTWLHLKFFLNETSKKKGGLA